MKAVHFLLMIALCCFSASTSWAQRPTTQPSAKLNECRTIAGQTEIEYEQRVDRAAFNKRLEQYVLNAGKRAVPDQYAIQLHIVRRDDGSGGVDADDVREEIEEFVNLYFAAINIEFVECGPEQYHNSSEYFILGDGSEDPDVAGDQMADDFNVDNVINIYFVSDPDEACGWARFPWDLPVDYIVIANGCATNNSTLVHELGHYFGLYHTHETFGGTKPERVTRANISGCTADCTTDGDLLCDTPADPDLSDVADDFPSCAYTGTATDDCSAAYTPDINNIMSYADKRCRDFFSPQQLARMEMFRDDERDYLTIVNAPAITTQASNMTVECDGSGNTAAFTNWLNTKGGAAVTDACGGEWSNNSIGLSNGCGSTGSETVTFTYTSTSGNAVTTTATFTIEDTTPPSLTCPDDIHLPECVETASWTVTTSDICGNVNVVSDPPSGSAFPKGSTTVVTLTATDECGNAAPQCTFEVTRDPDLMVTIDPLGTNSLNTCALGTGANIVLGYGGGSTCATLNAVGSGGHGPYTYAWAAPAEVPAGYFTDANTASPTFCAGFQTEACAKYTFLVTVMDIHGCTETNTVDVNVVNPLCTGGNKPKVWVCHHPPGNPSNEQSVCIGSQAVDNHLNGHGDDCLGHCDAICVTYSALQSGSIVERGNGSASGSEKFQTADSYFLAVKPNPFKTTAAIHFSAGFDINARLMVLDVNGREVANLFEGTVLRNTPYAVDFEAGNLEPGIYIARLIGEDGSSISSAVLLVK